MTNPRQHYMNPPDELAFGNAARVLNSYIAQGDGANWAGATRDIVGTYLGWAEHNRMGPLIGGRTLELDENNHSAEAIRQSPTNPAGYRLDVREPEQSAGIPQEITWTNERHGTVRYVQVGAVYPMDTTDLLIRMVDIAAQLLRDGGNSQGRDDLVRLHNEIAGRTGHSMIADPDYTWEPTPPTPEPLTDAVAARASLLTLEELSSALSADVVDMSDIRPAGEAISEQVDIYADAVAGMVDDAAAVETMTIISQALAGATVSADMIAPPTIVSGTTPSAEFRTLFMACIEELAAEIGEGPTAWSLRSGVRHMREPPR